MNTRFNTRALNDPPTGPGLQRMLPTLMEMQTPAWDCAQHGKKRAGEIVLPPNAVAPGLELAAVDWAACAWFQRSCSCGHGLLGQEDSRSNWASICPDLKYWSSPFGTAFFWNITLGVGWMTEHLSYFRPSLANIFREGKIWIKLSLLNNRG